jgi:chemotaxis protein CheZ
MSGPKAKKTLPESYERDQVIKIINSVLAKANQGDKATEAVFKEIHDLKAIIEEARLEIGSTRPDDISGKHIPAATDELDAIVLATAEATGTIMDSCETIQKSFDKMDAAVASQLENEVTKIFEACSFQDITGQRITKVVKTLKKIDEKITALLGVLGSKAPGYEEAEEEEEVNLLSGPQLPGKGVSQDDIDRMLAEFGD